MISLTTAQRDLLHQLLAADGPVSAAALGQRLHLTPRQVQYGLREVREWLGRRQATLRHAPGVGAQVICTPGQRQRLLAELAAQPRFQLILAPEQRQQLLALQLLAARDPFILSQLQDSFAVARATVLKDLDAVSPWLAGFRLAIGRRQHRGFWVEGPELARRQALAAMLWGDVPFERPLLAVAEGPHLAFALAQDAALLPAVAQTNDLLAGWDLAAAQQLVMEAEAELGARFTADAVRQLALELAIQLQRVAAGQPLSLPAEALRWAEGRPAWAVAATVAARVWAEPLPAEVAVLTVQLCSHERDEPLQSELAEGEAERALIAGLLGTTAAAFGLPALADDQLLRDGLAALVLPACLRQRFGLWAPPRAIADAQSERYAREREVADQLAAQIGAATGVELPSDAQDNLVLLLRAAVVRARPVRDRRVLVVCPSGMATTQLLVARLRARFPRLGSFEVLPIRSLSPERVAGADLIIATVPLALPSGTAIDVIQVHPMLHPEDIVALTNWMS